MLTDKERAALIKIISFEDKLPSNAFNEGQQFELGWSWSDIQVHPSILNNLLVKGVLLTLYKSNKHTGYQLTNGARKLLEEEEPLTEELIGAELEVPDDLFSVIEGYSDIKELFQLSLRSEPVDWLLCGVPGSSKTMFLSELERIGGSTPTILSGTASKVGIIDILFDYRPVLLLLDEFEHLNPRDYTILLSLCETRIISETKHGKTRRLELPNTRVFAGCNSTRNIPSPILDRMQLIKFRSYTRQEFMQVAINVLTKRMGLENNISEYIADETWEFSHSIRQVIRVAKMARTKKEVDNILEIIQRRG